MGVAANLVIKFGGDPSDFEKTVAGIERTLGKVAPKITAAGKTLTAAVTLPLVGAAIAATKFATDFESSFAGVRKTVKATDAQFEVLSAGFRQMAKQIPVGVNELNKIGEIGGQLGVPRQNLLDFTRVIAEIGVTTNLSTEDAATAFARFANITNMPMSELRRLGDVVVNLGNNLATTESEIVDFGLRIAGAGELAGMSEGRIMAIGAAFSSVGIQAEAGGTAVSKVIADMMSAVATGGKDLAQFGAMSGLGAQGFAKMFDQDSSGAFLSFIEGVGKQGRNALPMLNAMGIDDQRQLRAMLSLAIAESKQGGTSLLADAFGFADNSQGALAKEAGERFKTFASQLKLLKNEAYDVGISFGNVLIPALTRMTPAISAALGMFASLAQWFSGLPGSVQTGTLAFLGIVAAIGPVAIAVGSILNVGSSLLVLFRQIGGLSLATTLSATLAPAFYGVVNSVNAFTMGLTGIPIASAAVLGPLAAIGAALLGIYLAAPKAMGAVTNLRDAWQVGGFKAVLGELGRNEYNDNLSLFGDWRLDSGVGRTRGKDIELAADPVSVMAAQMKESQRIQSEVQKQFPELFTAMGGGDKLTPAQRQAKQAAEQSAAFNDRITGRAAIDSANDWMKHLADPRVGGLTRVTAKATEELHGVLEEALDAYQRIGQVAPKAMTDTWLATMKLPPVLQGLTSMADFAGNLSIGNQVGPFGIPTPPLPVGVTKGLGGGLELPNSIGPLGIPKGPGVFEGIMPQMQQVGQAFGAAIVDGLMQAQDKILAIGKNIAGSLGNIFGGTLSDAIGNAMKGAGFLSSGIGKALGGMMQGALGFLGPMLSGLVGKLFGPTEYEKRTRVDNDERKQINASMNVGELQRQADFTGRNDILDQLMRVKDSAAPEYLRQLMGDLTSKSDQLNAAMDRYGISWEQLGDKAKQSQINQMAEQFVLDFQVLTQAGADVNLVIEKMGGSVNAFIQTAMRTGTEVPIAMQPMLQKMLEMGLLVDANGVALADLSTITFAETLTQGIDRVVEAVNHLAQALGFSLPSAAQSAADGMNAAFATVRGPDISPRGGKFDVEGETAEFTVPQMAAGGVVRARAGGTLVNVGEGGRDEAIVPLGQSTLGSGSGSGAREGVMLLDGDAVGRFVLPLMVAEAQRLGVA
ncbi:hypothetical protein BH18ACI5_BH18ACI5_04450 [soil metagenome]